MADRPYRFAANEATGRYCSPATAARAHTDGALFAFPNRDTDPSRTCIKSRERILGVALVRTARVHAGPAISAWFDFVGDERLQSVCRHWDELVSGRKLPDRRELDPRAFKSALPFVWLCEHVAPANTYLVRLAGEEINRLFDRSIRLRVLEDFLDQPQRDELADKFDQVLAGPAVLWSRGLLFATFENGPLGECVALPLRDGGQVRLVLGATVYEWHHPAFRQQSMLHAGGLLPTETQDIRILGLDDI